MSSASDLRLRLLYSIGQRLESGLEYEDTLQQILTQLAHELNLTRAAISIYDRLGERLRVETTYPPDEGHPIPAMQDQIQDRALEGQTIVIPVLGRARKRGIDEAKVETKPNGGASPTNGHAVTTGLRDDTPVDPRPPEEISAVEAALMRGSCICTPVRHGLEVIGTLYIQKDRIEVYELADYSALMRAVSFMIAQHVRLWQRATESRDIAEQEHAQKQREAEESFAQVGMVGTSGAMKEVFAQVLQVAPTGTTVLVRGESGTGKELVAKA
ncbi:sigma 54-interacting transcriptional regulator, partial [bacterium]|nr:sigma 54-interacting transcriptional regulator [bacterium]